MVPITGTTINKSNSQHSSCVSYLDRTLYQYYHTGEQTMLLFLALYEKRYSLCVIVIQQNNVKIIVTQTFSQMNTSPCSLIRFTKSDQPIVACNSSLLTKRSIRGHYYVCRDSFLLGCPCKSLTMITTTDISIENKIISNCTIYQ